jgi:hypothetical protein
MPIIALNVRVAKVVVVVMPRKQKIEIIYYAHSKRIYGTDVEKRELEIIRKAYHTAIILNPSNLGWKSEPDWYHWMQNEFPKTDLVIFSDWNEFIGKGVYFEIEEAKRLSIPIKYLGPDGKITKYFRLGKIRERDWVLHSKVMKVKQCQVITKS